MTQLHMKFDRRCFGCFGSPQSCHSHSHSCLHYFIACMNHSACPGESEIAASMTLFHDARHAAATLGFKARPVRPVGCRGPGISAREMARI